MKQMAQAIAMPGKHAPVRFPSFPALERTAVLPFNTVHSHSLTGTLAGEPVEFKALLMRQATYPFWMDYLVENKAFSYGAGWVLEGKAQNASHGIMEALPGSEKYYMNSGGDYTTNTNYPGLYNGTADKFYYGTNYPLIGIDNTVGALEFIYVPAGCNIHLVVAREVSGAYQCTATLERWTSPGQTTEISFGAVDFTASAGNRGVFTTLNVSDAVWVRVKAVSVVTGVAAAEQATATIIVSNASATYAGSATTAGDVTIGTPGTKQVLLPVAGPTEFENSKLPWFSSRVTAVSVLLSNTTKVMNKEGTVLWGRVPPAVEDVWRVKSSYVNNLHPAEKAFLPLETGTYTYCPPSTDLSTFKDYTTNSSTTGSIPVVRLDNDSLVNVGFFSDPDGATSLAINVDWHLEFRTSSTLFPIGLSTSPIEALHSAQLALVKSGFFFDNFDHVAILNRIIGALGSLYPAMRVAAPMLKGVMSGASTATTLSRRSKPVRATSAARSGITGRQRAQAAASQSLNAWVDSQARRRIRKGPRSVASKTSRSSRRSRRSRVTISTRRSAR